MQYNGGKAKVARELAAAINLFKPKSYWEPFVGAANVIQFVNSPIRYASDIDPHIIAFCCKCQEGWLPPGESISEDVYHQWKNFEPSDTETEHLAMRAVIGYGCSYGAKFFAGFARNKVNHNFYLFAKNSISKMNLKGIEFRRHSYLENNPEVDLIYCDPPYSKTTRCGSTVNFNNEIFWAWCRRKAFEGINVLVTEFEAPSFAQEIWRKAKAAGLRKNNNSQMVERLFWVRP